MSYWRADSVVHIGEEAVEIPAERGLQYVVGATSRKVVFKVPPSIGIFSGKDSYLSWDMKILNTNVATTRLQLDPAGGGMMVQNIRLMNNGVVIEEINEYNQLVALKHDYDRDEALLKIKSVTEGGTCHNSFTAGTQGTSKSEMADLQTNPWFKAPTSATKNVAYSQATQGNSVKCCVPLHTGIFQGGAFPVLLMENGLTIEIDLAPAQQIVRQLDSVVRNRRRPLCAQVSGFNDAADTGAGGANGLFDPTFLNTNGAAVGAVAAGNYGANRVYIRRDLNSMSDISHFPFVVGERVGITTIANALKTDGTRNVIQFSSTDGGGPGPNVTAGPIIQSIRSVADGAGIPYFEITFTAALFNTMTTANGGDEVASANGFCMVSLSCDDGILGTAGLQYPVSYQVDNLNLVCHKLELEESQIQSMLSSARDGSAIEFDIMSVTNYKNSQLASERQSSFLINAKNQRAKALLTIPTDSTIYSTGDLLSSKSTYEVTQNAMDVLLNSARAGISGCCDQLSEYQLQISGINVPSRPVSTRKIATRNSIDAFFLYELEKALANSDIDPRSFSKYMESFVIGRSFGTFNGAQDLRNEDLTIQLRYGETTAPSKPKMFSTFITHVRRIRLVNGFVVVDM